MKQAAINYDPSGDDQAELEARIPPSFFNSENWKLSEYQSTIIPTFALSLLTSVVEYNQEEIT